MCKNVLYCHEQALNCLLNTEAGGDFHLVSVSMLEPESRVYMRALTPPWGNFAWSPPGDDWAARQSWHWKPDGMEGGRKQRVYPERVDVRMEWQDSGETDKVEVQMDEEREVGRKRYKWEVRLARIACSNHTTSAKIRRLRNCYSTPYQAHPIHQYISTCWSEGSAVSC